MSIISLIFTTGSGLVLFISGLFKIISIRESSNVMYKITFLPKKIAKIIGYLFPIIELLIATLLILRINNLLINTIAILMLSTFVIFNANAVLKHNHEECFCFGKILKTRMGIGGLVQSSLLLLSLLPNIVLSNLNIITIFSFESFNFEFATIIITIIIWATTLIVIRTIIDKLLILDS
ncbi:MauE/DoxX family redox-associated membrane protein [Bacillus cereus]|uniref:Methylamine utilisation protein MauE domain-containing protein n=1 Tax=Bacillus cereus TaxID=1396 RepID=A0AA44Q6J9_BACCE|nr:MauE/DoxX family redox-associated membrane protein [Bacillus cereus]PFN00483.1 hypothetical protein COJ55_25050 [Bacillus cereus]PFR90752.1 hypothetical protein COK38_23305 [Bacillus cereus]